MRGTRIGSQYVWGGLLLTVLAASPLRAAQVVFVDDLGDCQGGVPCFTTIQQGVNNASAPPTEQAEVRVFPGTYNESVNLFLIGSAVGGVQVNVLIVNTEFFGISGSPATSPAIGDSRPPWLSAELAAQIESARQRIPRSTVSTGVLAAAEGAAAGVPLLPVTVNSPGGAAIYGSNLVVDVTIVGIDVHSPNANGVDIISTGDLEFNLGSANDNFGTGVSLESTDGDVGAVFSTFNDNGGAGAALVATDGDVSVVNCIADRNTLDGFSLLASSSVMVFSFPLGNDPLFAGFPMQVAARRNMGNGIVAQSQGEAVTVVDFQVLLGLMFTPTIILDDNTLSGLSADGDEGVTAAGVQANRNDLDGLSLNSRLGVTLFSIAANDNMSQGVFVLNSDYLLAISAVVTGNRNGVAATSDGTTDPFDGFPAFGALLIAITADDNMLNGILMNASGGPIFIYASTAISNGVVGVQMQSPVGSQNQVIGGIICENTIGLAQETNAMVNAEGNWWGSVSGPFHTTKNPGGTGNSVADGTSGGGMGDVDFTPWIDTVTATVNGALHFGSPTPITFQFSGGNGTVFLGPPQGVPFLPIFGGFQSFGPGGRPPFIVSTPDGIIDTALESGPSAATFLTAFQGIAQVNLIPLKLGPVSATITGPCGLTATLTANAGGAQVAPLLSGVGLFAAFAALLAVAAVTLRRSGPPARRIK